MNSASRTFSMDGRLRHVEPIQRTKVPLETMRKWLNEKHRKGRGCWKSLRQTNDPGEVFRFYVKREERQGECAACSEITKKFTSIFSRPRKAQRFSVLLLPLAAVSYS